MRCSRRLQTGKRDRPVARASSSSAIAMPQCYSDIYAAKGRLMLCIAFLSLINFVALAADGPVPNSDQGVKVIGYLFTTTGDPSRDPAKDSALLDAIVNSSLPLYGEPSIGLPLSDNDPRLNVRDYPTLCATNGVGGIIELTVLRLRGVSPDRSLTLDMTLDLRTCDGRIVLASEYRSSHVDPSVESKDYSQAASHIISDILRKSATLHRASYGASL